MGDGSNLEAEPAGAAAGAGSPTVRVVGVGLGRTGTHSLKVALEALLGRPCFHMLELLASPERIPGWMAALDGRPDWPVLLDGFGATVDWPGTVFWRELVACHPDAVVLLSRRESADVWWESAKRTIFMGYHGDVPGTDLATWADALRALYARQGIDPADEAVSKRAYQHHLDEVRATVPADRLVEWAPGDGWAPLCDALGLAVPADPFPHRNSTREFRSQFALVG